jgi:hypothetical protein
LAKEMGLPQEFDIANIIHPLVWEAGTTHPDCLFVISMAFTCYQTLLAADVHLNAKDMVRSIRWACRDFIKRGKQSTFSKAIPIHFGLRCSTNVWQRGFPAGRLQEYEKLTELTKGIADLALRMVHAGLAFWPEELGPWAKTAGEDKV